MNLVQDNSALLKNMLKTLGRYKRNKDTLLSYYVNKRLNDSLQVYYSELSNSFDYLQRQNTLKVAKTMNKVF